MKKILAFGASNSRNSINKRLAHWAASKLEDVEVVAIALEEFALPLFSVDLKNEEGVPELTQDFKKLVNESDGIIISFAENNGTFTAAFKNIYDWLSMINKPIWGDKPMMILSTSPGARGGSSVLKTAAEILPFRGAKIAGVFSLPSFGDNFNDGITNSELLAQFHIELEKFRDAI